MKITLIFPDVLQNLSELNIHLRGNKYIHSFIITMEKVKYRFSQSVIHLNAVM